MVETVLPNQTGNNQTWMDTDPKFFNDLVLQELPNLSGEVELWWSEDTLRNNRFKDIFDGTKVIGYEDGVKPIKIEQNNLDGTLKTNAQKFEEIYNIVTYNRDKIPEKRDAQATIERRDETGMLYTVTDSGKIFDVDMSEEERQGFFRNILGELLPFVDSDNEKANRKGVEKELSLLGLDADKTKELRGQLAESHYYVAQYTDKKKGWVEGKIGYHEQTKDLSYLVPDVNDYSVMFQARQILGNMTDDFPSLFTGLYSTTRVGLTKLAMEPDKTLLSPYHKKNIFGMVALTHLELAEEKEFIPDEEGRYLKDPEEFQRGIDVYTTDKEKQLQYIAELVSHFDERKHTERGWASFKNLWKNIVYNNTQFELTEEMMKNLENPTDSFLYHATDIITEGLPYIAVIEGVIMAYGIKGTVIANEAVEYALKNTGKGLKFSNPLHATNHYLKQFVAKSKLYSDKQRDKFLKRTLTRLEERQTSTLGLKQLKTSLKKEIGEYEIKIAQAKGEGNVSKLKRLKQAQQTLIKNEADLTSRYFTKSQKSLFTNEVFASITGGIGRDIWGDNLIGIAWELGGAFTEPFITSNGMRYIGRTAAINTARFLDGLSIITDVIPGGPASTEWLKAVSLDIKPEEMVITDKLSGLTRKLTTREVAGIRQFTDILRKLPPEDRINILESMYKADGAMKSLYKNLSEEDQVTIQLTLGQYSGLVSLQAIEEMHRIKVDASDLTPDSIVQTNEYIQESAVLLTAVDKAMRNILQRNPGNPDVSKFVRSIQENLKLIDDTVQLKKDEYLDALEAMMDLQKNVNLFNDGDMYSKNIQNLSNNLKKLKENGFSEDVQATANKLLQDLDKAIIKDMRLTSESLMGDGSNYQIGQFNHIVKGLAESFRIKYKNAYTSLFEEDRNFQIDFTKTVEDIMGGLFPAEKRFGKYKDVTGLLSGKLPPTKDTAKFINVFTIAAQRNTLDYIRSVKNKEILYDAFAGEVPDTIKPILAKITPINDIDAKLIYDALGNDLIKYNKNYKNVPKGSVTSIDIRDLLSSEGAIIPIKMNLEEAMEVRSALGSFQFAAVQKKQPKLFTWKELGDSVEVSIFKSIEDSGKPILAQKYEEAINSYRDYNGRFNSKRFKQIKAWMEMVDGGTLLKNPQDEAGNFTSKLERIEIENPHATNLLQNSFGGGTDDVVAHGTHNLDPNTWVDWGRLLSDEKYADDFMRNVIQPLVGNRNMELAAELGSDINYIIDLADPQIIDRLTIIRGFLNEGIANHIRRTDQGKLVIGEKNIKKILAEDSISKRTPIKIAKLNINNNNQGAFRIDGISAAGENKTFQVINIDNAIKLNLSIDNLIARNRFIAEIAKDSNTKLAKQYRKSKKFISKEVTDLEHKLKVLDDSAVISNFGTSLKDPKIFVEEIIIKHDASDYNKLKRIVTGTGNLVGDIPKLTSKEFDTVSKELFAEYFYKRFARPAAGKKTEDVIEVFDAVGAKVFLEKNKKVLTEVYGTDHIKDVDFIMNLVLIKTGLGNKNVMDVSRYPTSLSLESLMSRVYSVQRGIISLRYVAGEIALRRFRKNRGNILKLILQEPEFAKVIKKVLESDDIYKNPELSTKLEKLLNENVVKAIFLREGSEIILEHREEKQDKLLNVMNQELYKFKQSKEAGFIQ